MLEVLNEIAASFEGYNIIVLTFVFLIMWFALAIAFLYVPIPAKNLKMQKDMQNRVVSIIHGVIILGCGAYEVFVSKTEIQDPNNWFEQFWGAWSMAYFIHDTVMMLILGLADTAILIHHFVITVGFIVMIS